jgi:hypothetical protein
MIICRECGYRNPSGTTFCENRECGSFLEWSGDVFPTEMVPRVVGAGAGAPPPSPRPATGNATPQRAGLGEVGLTVYLPERELQVEPGETVSCKVTIRNTGRIVDQYSVQVFGEAGRWTTVDAPINLVPEAEGTVGVTFHPPRRSDVLAGTTPFRLLVTSREDLRATAFADGTVTVAAFHEAATQLRPQYAEGRSAAYQVVVENRGNAPIGARLDASDPRQALELRISPPAFSVPPGGRSAARVDVRPRQRPLSGPPLTYPFRVTAQAGWDAPRAMDAQFVYKPSLPKVGRGWLTILRILLVVLGGLMMILGSFSDWLGGVDGADLTYELYVEAVFENDVPSPPDGLGDTLVSLGLVTIVLGVLALLGLATRTGRLTRVAAGIGLVLMVVYLVTVADSGFERGSGPVIVLVGAIFALIGGILALSDKK